MRTTNAWAELEIGLHRARAGGQQVELRFTNPATEAEVPPERGTAALNFAELLALHHDPDGYGRTLADGLFRDDNVRGLYQRARAVAEAGGSFLRVRLLLGRSAAELHALRWELLRDPEAGAPIATSERILFSRFMLSRDWRPVTLRPRSEVKALIAVAAPADLVAYDLAEVDVEGEVGRARESLCPSGNGCGIDVRVAGEHEPLTLERLVGALQDEVDVLYLVCHGTLPRGGEPILFLQDEDGKTATVAGAMLARAVAELDRPPRLAVLASCRSGGTGEGPTDGGRTTAETSLAPMLAEAGVPAIIAMQGKITMQTVAHLMPVFFRELLVDGRIDRALAVARGAVRDRYDAWMPALYLRLRRGCIWQEPEADGMDQADHQTRDTLTTQSIPRLKIWPPPELPGQPYPVLLPYTHPELMAGREQEIARLRRELRTPVPILGLGAPSGIGKSSLLLAGLVPVLRAEKYLVAFVRHPQEKGVAARLVGDLLGGIGELADEDWQYFIQCLAYVEIVAREPPLLVLDQFEDVLRSEAAAARARLGVLLAATTRRQAETDEPLCRWLLAYRTEYHGELLAWLEDVLLEAREEDAYGKEIQGLPYDLAGPDRFQSLPLTPLATPPAGSDPLAEATRTFQAVIEKPLAVRTPDGHPRYPLRFSEGHAERLARIFAQARIGRPDAPLVPELQVVLAHLVARASPDGLVSVPERLERLVDQALANHLRFALEAAFPAGTRKAATRRARALLALRQLATVTGQQVEGIAAEELARAVGDDGEKILEQLATPMTRLVVLRDAPDGPRYVLSHDQMAEVVVRAAEEEGRHGKLLVDAELLALRRFVTLRSALHHSQSEEVATRMRRRQYRGVKAHAEALLWDDERRAWWTACRKRRRADVGLATAATALALLCLTLVTLGTRSWVLQRRHREALVEQIARGDPGPALRALDELVHDPPAFFGIALRTSDEELLGKLRQRDVPMDVLEKGLGEIPEKRRGAVVLRAVEIALPWVAETPQDPVLIANLVWALDYAPGRDPSSAAAAQVLRDRVLEPLRRIRPPPEIAGDDPDWVGIPAGTFLMGSPDGEGFPEEHPQHQVTVSAFGILRHEVTYAQYRLLEPGYRAEREADRPATKVTWYQAYAYAAWLGGRLPTEAEWEYAARAGCPYVYCNRDGQEATVDEVAWTQRNVGDRNSKTYGAKPVMRLEPNPWGLYDMLGNAFEWTADWYADTYPAGPLPAEPQADPWGPDAGTDSWRVIRGSSYFNTHPAAWARVALRGTATPSNVSAFMGFRVVLPGRW